MLAIIKYTFKELIKKKIFIFLAIFIAITLLSLAYILFSKTYLNLELFFMKFTSNKQIISNNKFSNTEILNTLQGIIVSIIYSFTLFITIFSANSLMPSFLKSGNIELFLQAPLSRFKIIISRYLGVVLFATIIITSFILGFWILIFIKTGNYNINFLLSGILMCLFFASIYSVSTFLAVVFRNRTITLLGTFLIITLSPILAINKIVRSYFGQDSNIFLDIINNIIPNFFKNIQIIFNIASNTYETNSYLPLGYSLISATVFLAISIYIFQRREF